MHLFRHQLAALAVKLWPTDVGLSRIMRYVAPPPVQLSAPIRLRGFPLNFTFSPRTYLGKFLYYRNMYEEAQIGLLRTLLRPDMTFVDVGANYGLYSVIAAHLTGPDGCILAIEPQHAVADVLRENLRLNNLSNVVVEEVALGDRPGTAILHQVSRTNVGQATIAIGGNEQSFQSTSVEVATLPTLLTKHSLASPRGMKIDVEGGEKSVLDGFDWTTSCVPEFIFIEVVDEHLNRFNTDSASLLSLLCSHGYVVACRYRGKWRTIRDVQDHARFGNSPDCVAIHSESQAWKAAGRCFS